MSSAVRDTFFACIDYLLVLPVIAYFLIFLLCALFKTAHNRLTALLYALYLSIPITAAGIIFFLMSGSFDFRLTFFLMLFPFAPLLLLIIYLRIIGHFKKSTKTLVYMGLAINLLGQFWLSFIARTLS